MKEADVSFAPFALVAMLLAAPGVLAAEAQCTAVLARSRALVSVTLHGVLDPELLRVVRLGLAGKLSLEVTLLRKRFLFGRAVARAAVELLVSWSEEREQLLLDGRPLEDPAHVALERIALDLGDSPDDAGYEVEASARFQVLTSQSLSSMARWIAGNSGEERSALSRNLVGVLASDLSRSASCSCPAKPLNAPR